MLVSDRMQKPNYSLFRECSAARAPIRALAAYLETIRFGEATGFADKFQVVQDGKADPEDLADYPSACVYVEGGIRYAEDGSIEPTDGIVIDNSQLLLAGDVQLSALVHVWTNEDEHREIVLAALEDAFSPVEWMAGFQLEMPHYYGCRAQYQLIELTYEDSPDDVQRRYRKLSAQLQVRSPYARMFSLPRIGPRMSLDVG
jgi:hypothetical protein